MITPQAFSCTKSVTASILGPSITVSNTSTPKTEVYLISTADEPAHIIINASFLPKYTLTRDRRVSMRLTVEKINPYPHDLYLQSFQMLLVGYTDIRAGSATSTQRSCHTIQSLSNINMQLFSAFDDAKTQRSINPALWDEKMLPDFVIPSFDACGLSMRYELEILMGFQCRGVTVCYFSGLVQS